MFIVRAISVRYVTHSSGKPPSWEAGDTRRGGVMMTRRVNLVRDYVKVGRKVDEKKWAGAKDSGNKGKGGGNQSRFSCFQTKLSGRT